jgi:hypothetical protein
MRNSPAARAEVLDVLDVVDVVMLAPRASKSSSIPIPVVED